ncbi:MAG: tail fiber domain-containing protein [Candidatus Dormibacteria bacterium]
MAISVVTTSVPTANSGGQGILQQSIFFNHNSVSNFSKIFEVNQEPFYIEAYNFGATDIVTVQMVSYANGIATYTNYQPVYGLVQLTNNRTKIRLDFPGSYRLIYSGPGVAAIIVVGFAATMTHESISGMQEAIQDIVVAPLSGSFLQGINPIVVTGSGTGTAPYEISIPAVNTLGTGNLAHSTLVGVNFDGLGRPIYPVGNGQPFCTAVGEFAGVLALQPVPYDTAVGWSAGTSFGEADVKPYPLSCNTSMGFCASSGATNNIDTVAIGVCGNVQNFEGQSNVAIGSFALGPDPATTTINTSGSIPILQASTHAQIADSVAIGAYSAVMANTGTGGAGLTAVGFSAGFKANNCQYCIFSGANAGHNETHTNVIIIGASSTSVNATANSQIILGTSTQTQLVTAGSVIQGGAISASDSRLKRDVKNICGAVEKINALRPVVFHWKENSLKEAGLPYLKSDMNKQQSGLIAQELEKVFPEVVESVCGTDKEWYRFIHYDRLVPIMLAAIKELSAEVAALKQVRG